MPRKIVRKLRPRKPFTRFWLYAGERPTGGGMSLIRALAGKRIKPGGGRFKHSSKKIVINWGTSADLPWPVLNRPEAIRKAVDKLKFFQAMTDARLAGLLPAFTTDKTTANNWRSRANGGWTVVARTILNGHSGEGIVIRTPRSTEELPDAGLYTAYIPKDEEYRLHFFRTGREEAECFYSQKKVKRADFEGKHNRRVRSFENGYTYQHNGLQVPGKVNDSAKIVFLASGLDFGAVDVIYCRAPDRAYVLEINTAPGLEGESITRYTEEFKKYFS